MVKSSIYFYLFNIKSVGFDYKEAIVNFCAFADEVVVATIKDEDDSFALLSSLQTDFPTLKVILSDIKLSDNRFDGKLKTAALKATTHPIKVIADADERFPLSQKSKWQKEYEILMTQPAYDGFLVPSLDLWGDVNNIRLDKEIGQKFRVHKNTIVSRGVVPFAETENGHFDITKSDSTEPLNVDGQLGNFYTLLMGHQLYPIFAGELVEKPYVLHHGYVDLKKRAEKVNFFWKPHWEARSGKEESVVLDSKELTGFPTTPHNLPLE